MRKSLLLFALLLLSACSNAVPEESLVGNYIADFRGEIAALVLKPDHTYVHTIRANNRQIAEDVGTWKVTQMETARSKTTVVEFWDFRLIPSFRETEKDKSKIKVGWATQVELDLLWRVQLCFDSDVGYCYSKQ
ncbi:hypothetical protein V1277_004559 [Bradyrhizobium sp. AZCC 1588]|uniref:hypothetical protein n=1 Tax=unclassified Bradyrhizobium TaxID=2631580 RepID=UPI002FF09625